jgi:drug/metabolite transporter (DMT)-like permease
MAFFLKPFLAALLAWMVLGEALTAPMFIGGAFILGGMVVALVKFPSGERFPRKGAKSQRNSRANRKERR